MSDEFAPIETQEDFDRAIKDRIRRERDKVRSEFADYEELKAEVESSKAALEEAIARAERAEGESTSMREAKERADLAAKVSSETGVPASLIHGSTEDEMRACAQAIADYARPKGAPRAPRAGSFDNRGASDSNDARRELARRMFGTNE